MLKVFLVEDEYIIREGIKKNINWAANNLEFCGEATDGELAFPLICREKPDILITDIKMPFMNGLELSALVKKELPETEIIILSGYEEFEYAKEGIRLGVAEYLLKPVSGNELLEHVNKLADKIYEKRSERELLDKYRQEMRDQSQNERRELFDSLVSGTRTVTELMKTAEKLDIDVTAVCYCVVLTKFSDDMEQEGQETTNIDAELEQILEDVGAIRFDRELEGEGLLFKADTEEQMKSHLESFRSRFTAVLEKNRVVRYFGGIGSTVLRLSDIPKSFKNAGRAFAHRFLTSRNLILYGEDIEKNQMVGEDFTFSSVNPKQVDRTRLKEFLKTGDLSETRFFVEEFFRGLGPGALNSNLFRQYILMDMYFCVAEFVEGLHEKRELIDSISSESIIAMSDVRAAIDYICKIIEEAIGIRDRIASNRYSDIVEAVIEEIKSKYSDEELSVAGIAEKVSFSPNHLSTIFRQQTGQTIIKYITDFRMTKAKELLKCTSMRSSEIGAEVGYKDPHYFSFMFKKQFGVTPTQYRENNDIRNCE